MMDEPDPLERLPVVAVVNVALARTLKHNCVAVVWMKELRDDGMEKKISEVEDDD
jgi:hypothetical protein